MGKMHPDDVNARDWEFMLSDRFPARPHVTADDPWVSHGLKWVGPARQAEIKGARRALFNAWPDADEGQTLEPWIAQLERAFEPKRPAVSNGPWGDSTNAESQGRALDERLAEQTERAREFHAPHRGPRNAVTETESPLPARPPRVRERAHGRCVVCNRPSRVHAEYCTPCWRELRGNQPQASKQAKLDVLKLRLRNVCRRFGALDIQVEPMERGGQLGISFVNYDRKRWSMIPGAVMTLTEAELWLDHFEETCQDDTIKAADEDELAQAGKLEHKLLDAFGVQPHMFKRPRSGWG